MASRPISASSSGFHDLVADDVLRPVLVVGPSWVGDMVMSQSLYMTLASENPEIAIDVLAPGWCMPLLERMPQVRRAIEMPLTHGELGLSKRYRLGKKLRSGNYRQAIVLPRSFKSALVPFHAGIPKRTGYRGEFRYGLLNDIRHAHGPDHSGTVWKFLALGRDADVPLPETAPRPKLRVDNHNQENLIAQLDIEPYGQIIALMPGAQYGPAKCWPPEYYAQLAARLTRKGAAVWILGSQQDQAVGEQIASEPGNGIRNLCGQTTLVDTIDLLALASAAVSNDSGLMHVAAAVGIPLVAIFGSSSPNNTPPLSDKAKSLFLGLDCSPCYQRECPLGHLNCLRQISPDAVLQNLELLLAV